MMNTEGLDNDNNMMIRERRTGGESSPEPAAKSLNMGSIDEIHTGLLSLHWLE
jgi:hypothetical protein